MARIKIESETESHREDTWMKDTLLLTCVLRLRVQPAVPYTDIANILLKTMSKQISGVNGNPANLAKLLSAATTYATSANTISTDKISANMISANSISANSTSAKSVVVDEKRQRDMCMKQWLVQNLREDFMGAEFRGDQAWWRAKNMDADFVGKILRTGQLDRKHMVASVEEMKLQILWRRIGDWRADSVLEEQAEAIIQEQVGIIGDRRI